MLLLISKQRKRDKRHMVIDDDHIHIEQLMHTASRKHSFFFTCENLLKEKEKT